VRVAPLAAVRRVGPPEDRRSSAPGALAAALVLTAVGLVAEIRFDSPWGGNLAALATDFFLVVLFMREARLLSAVVLRPLRGRGRLAVERLADIPPELALAGGVLALGLGLMIMAGTLARSFEASVLDFIHHRYAPTSWSPRRRPRDGSSRPSTRTWPRGSSPSPAWPESSGSAWPSTSTRGADQHRLPRRDGVRARSHPGLHLRGRRPASALDAVRTGTGILVSRNFARQFRVGVGDTLRLETPAGPYAARVSGVVVDYVSPRGSVILSRPLYQRWWATGR